MIATLTQPALEDAALVPLDEARAFFPEVARPAYKTIVTWASAGVGGIRLPCKRIGGRLFTTAAGVEWFLNRLNETAPVCA